ncbi:hypothetical protein [Desulfovermiculus halophilus]|uniref:[protein-PII] uridylyltransferase family protein n=1 Tax=Desulfovermiculus halophilus TaxID=339722 RepID=UPI00129480B5|nr:hypothetical protein [Desulfovermiculus halophilus]
MRTQQPTTPDLDRLRTGSRYLARLLHNEELVHWLMHKRALWRKVPLPELYRELHQSCTQCATFTDVALAFRAFKQRHFARLAGRDAFGLADFSEVVSQVGDLARACLQAGLHLLDSRPDLWTDASALDPDILHKGAGHLGVLGLGKLGGDELNFVSDIDLMFVHDLSRQGGAGQGGYKPVLRRLSQALIRLVSEQVGGDRVFIVDMRLRPGGREGEMVVSVDQALNHYQIHGRSWERQALLKARPVAGQRGIGNSFLDQIRPFVFRRFLDFQALDELKAMRDHVLDEARGREDAPFNLKLGVGGIREVEFVVQSMQLVYGGRHPGLDEPNTLRCLQVLTSLGLMPREAADSLSSAYILLRRTEHWVQLESNRQTHVLPRSDQDMDRLAAVLGFSSGAELSRTLQEVRDEVHSHFSALFRPSASVQDPGPGEEAGSWGARMAEDIVSCPPFRREVRKAVQAAASRLEKTGDKGDGNAWSIRVGELLHKAGVRPGLTVLLNRAPWWLEHVMYATAVSRFVSSLLLHQPSLLEGLPENELSGPDPLWADRAWSIVHRERGYEQRLEWIRRLKNERMLEIVVNDLRGWFGPAGAEEELTALADWTIQATWEAVVSHYVPDLKLPIAVLGLGKLGSREMGYLSDVDLMFVCALEQDTDQIPARMVKLIQRFMRMVSTPLQEGPGYVVDAQIRPSGTYGPLIVSVSRWLGYYHREADVWEIQALLRMRAVGGNSSLGQQLEEEAGEICAKPRAREAVWPRLCQLRQRMEVERSRETRSTLDLKLGPGGLADVEFLIQGVQLTRGGRQMRALGVIDLIDMLGPEAGLSTLHLDALRKWYVALRSLELRLQLLTNQAWPLISRDTFIRLQENGLWPPGKAGTSIREWSDIQVGRREIRKMWERMCV